MAALKCKLVSHRAINSAIKSIENAKVNLQANLESIEGISVKPASVLYACRGFDVSCDVELNGRAFHCLTIFELNEEGDLATQKSGVSYKDGSGEWQTDYTNGGTIAELFGLLLKLAGK